MKRDVNLIRKMVFAIEDAESGWAPELSFGGHSESQIGYHAYLLVDAGLCKGVDASAHGSEAPQALITSLTWAGHEFADAARDETRWKKALGIATEKGGTVTFEVLKQLLLSLMKDTLGLS